MSDDLTQDESLRLVDKIVSLEMTRALGGNPDRHAASYLREAFNAHITDRIAALEAQLAEAVEALAYVLRAYDYAKHPSVEDTLLVVPDGSKVFSVTSARATLARIKEQRHD